MSHFYLTLPSNSSEKFYPNNTLAQFSTKLQEDVSLDGVWEVGLAEISFPKKWFNINEDQYISIFCYDCRDITPEMATKPKNMTYTRHIKVSPGYYRNMNEIIDKINALVELTYTHPIAEWKDDDTDYFVSSRGRPEFAFDALCNKAILRVPAKTRINKSTTNIQQILGFSNMNTIGIYNTRRRPMDQTGD